MTLPPLGAYLHLPWCERKCPYCDFNSHAAEDFPEDAYIDALIEDLRGEYAGETRPVETVFIGGGTPSLFSVVGIARLLDGLQGSLQLADDAEITMEANPGSAETTKLAGFAAAGVNRFSLGVQSFNDGSLARLGRVHDANSARRAIVAARASGAQSFNVDLMHGLPAQGSDCGLADIDTAIAAGAPHISWYQLTIERNTRFYRERPILPTESVLEALETEGVRRLQAAGFERYEVSAWARPGARCRHNLNYWRFGDYLAAGAGAHGKRTLSDGRILRYSKTRLPADYLAVNGRRRCAERELDATDRRGEFMLNALRLREGFELSLFEARTGLDAAAIEAPVAALEARGLLQQRDGHIACTDLGWRFLDDVVGCFF